MITPIARYGTLAACLFGAAFFLSGAVRHAEREFSANALTYASPVTDIRPLRLRHTIAAMSLEEKIGQMMMVSIPAPTLPDKIAAWLSGHHIGGVVLLGKNVQNRAQIETLIRDMQVRGRTQRMPPFFIAVDQEGGAISRFRFLEEMRPQNALKDTDMAYTAAKRRGEELRKLGVNVNFSPVVDVAESTNNFIRDRAFGGDAAQVAALGSAMIRGYQDADVIAVPKHFPGHGGTIVDSHRRLPTITRDQAAWDEHLLPFREASAARAGMMMTAHVLAPAIDPENPASISPAFGRILREDIGYSGIVITDDLAMGAISRSYGIPDAAVRAASAGADILLAVEALEQYDGIYQALLAAVRRGDIGAVRIDASVMRILALKEAFLKK
ncbi:MAG: hypothetical protein A3C92_00565 [Candidatus Sungbacteria bacterium RIFCSPHIGHO2_02_FULL_53_17]|uniref:beta-N-acetylhexosaminidase n=1 Tax=Candidatus Sungbacteria bacterium RIFCSPHIGHO2_02_FULL_53_17 TaxID=1802275 RepID=A0A1G2KUD7_9BACT|nr:MAG: hypothetical protein A3C92_00565 [Candidatus Sungbacteria bacterium RIFCSPHIGHO2_02_FULL_53_17]